MASFSLAGGDQATKDAGRLAGLNVRRVANEPTAAVIVGLGRIVTLYCRSCTLYQIR